MKKSPKKLEPAFGVPHRLDNLFAEIRESIQLDVAMPAALDLFDEVQADERLIVAVP